MRAMTPHQVWEEHAIRRGIEGYQPREAGDDSVQLILDMMPTDDEIRARLRLADWSEDQIAAQLLGLKDVASTSFVLR